MDLENTAALATAITLESFRKICRFSIVAWRGCQAINVAINFRVRKGSDLRFLVGVFIRSSDANPIEIMG